MMQHHQLVDQQHRDRIQQSLDENLFVEAGAGTGKTTALVGRIVTLIASGVAEMAGLTVITFTEAAAAELRDRVRRNLEYSAEDESLDEDSRYRCRRAVLEMDAASIQTLHSFAQSLLRELPLEAGLPPGFELLDPIEADMRFQQAWDQWLDESLESTELGPKLARALHLGLNLDQLRRVASALNDNYDLVADASIAETPEPTLTIGNLLAEAVTEIERLRRFSKIGGGDGLYEHAAEVIALAQRLPATGGGDRAYERVLVRLLGLKRLSTRRGSQTNWNKDDVTGVNACKLLKDILLELEGLRAGEIGALRTAAFTPVFEAVRKFVVDQSAQRKEEGHAGFHDLLVWARDMLRDNPDARRRFQRRFHHLLVDEFQDTDPIQAEIAFFLGGDLANHAESISQDWEGIVPTPGKLFMVGDPKQSIYRFRRADIETMAHVRNHLVSESTPLQQNFRSQQSIISWVNHVFGRWMRNNDGSELQAEYRDLIATHGLSNEGVVPPHAVYYVGESVSGNADFARRLEGQTVAVLARRIKEEKWQVRSQNPGEWRDATYRDICLLLPSRTNLEALEQALEALDVPYRIESESVVLGSEDVRQLLNCLRAIDSPGDQVALVAALQSTAFSCSDVELLQFVDDGGRFDYLHPGSATGPVAEALAVLREFSKKCGLNPADELIEEFIRERRLVELSFNRRRPRERWRRLRFVVEQARAYQRAGGNSLRGFLDWIERQVEERARAVESPAPESDEDCVRIMTIHAAKGLEFPVVVLTGFGSTPNRNVDNVIVDRTSGEAEIQLSLPGGIHVSTTGYEAAKSRETAAAAAEDVRLAYVACTRAKDHLLVSLFRRGAKSDTTRAAKLEEFCADRLDLFQKLDWESLVEAAAAYQPKAEEEKATSDDDFSALRAQWEAQRESTIEKASQPQAQAATAIAQRVKGQLPSVPAEGDVTSEKVEAGEGEIPYLRGRGGTNLGRAVHAVLQSIDLLNWEGFEDICRAQAEAEGIGELAKDVLELSRNALETETVKGLIESVKKGSANYYREVFVSAKLSDRLMEGFIDLLIETPDGISIVDYKTDRLTAKQVQELGPEYEVQLGLYAWAVGETTGRPVREATLLFLRPQEERRFPDPQALILKALDAAKV